MYWASAFPSWRKRSDEVPLTYLWWRPRLICALLVGSHPATSSQVPQPTTFRGSTKPRHTTNPSKIREVKFTKVSRTLSFRLRLGLAADFLCFVVESAVSDASDSGCNSFRISSPNDMLGVRFRFSFFPRAVMRSSRNYLRPL